MKHYKEQNAREAWTGIWFIRGGKQRKKDNYIGRPVRCHWKYFRWNIFIIVAPRHGHRSFLLKYVCCCRIIWIDEYVSTSVYFNTLNYSYIRGRQVIHHLVSQWHNQKSFSFLLVSGWLLSVSYWEREPIVFTVKTATAQIDGQFNYQSNERSLIMKFWNFFLQNSLLDHRNVWMFW